MNLAVIMKLLHVLAAFAFVTGLIGRNVLSARAARSTSFEAAAALFRASEFFERLVIFGSMAVFLLGILTALLQRWPLFGFLQGGDTNWVFASLLLFVVPFVAAAPLLSPHIRQRRQAAEAALKGGAMTPEFQAALNDPFVQRFRAIELAVVAIIILLMVSKPF